MKELEILNDNAGRKEVQAKRQQETQLILDGIIRPHRGHTVFEINADTKEIREATYREVAASFAKAAKGDYSPDKELVITPGRVYVPALNKAAALRKFDKNPEQASYYAVSPIFSLKDSFFQSIP